MSKDSDGFNPSWFLTILMLAVFWPVGLWFLWCKLQNGSVGTETSRKKRGKRISFGGFALIALAVVMMAENGASVAWAAFLGLGGAALMFFNNFTKKKNGRFKRYKAIIGSRITVPIEDIISVTGSDRQTVLDDLQQMIDDKWFGDYAYLDMGNGVMVTDSRFAPAPKKAAGVTAQVAKAARDAAGQTAKAARDAAEQTAKAAREAAEQVTKAALSSAEQAVKAALDRFGPSSGSANQAAPQPAAQPASQRPAANIPEREKTYVNTLRQIRKANDAIKDEKVSAQIDRIEQITGNIFEVITEHPEKQQEVHTFMNYYLPTTLKLLSAYGRLEKQNVSGENIDSAKAKIEKLLDQLVWAFERQNDQLFKNDALDINSDITVMETMLQKDGLAGSGGLPNDPFAAALGRKPAGGAAVAQARQKMG